MTSEEIMTWRTEKLSDAANSIVNLVVASLNNWLAVNDPNAPKYPPVWSIADEVQGTLPLSMKLTQQDIYDASVIISSYYPDFADFNTLVDELSRAMSTRIIQKRQKSAKWLLLPVGVLILILMPGERG
jgi:hypothetical protein